MKTILVLLFPFFVTKSYSQDNFDLKRIDSIVTTINYSKLKANQDSIIQNFPNLGLSIKSYLTMVVENNQLKKYVNYVNTDRLENGVTIKATSCNTFYYDQNKLIKVEECSLSDNQAIQFDWYFLDDRCLYHSLQSDKAESRATLLLSMSKEMIKKVIKKVN